MAGPKGKEQPSFFVIDQHGTVRVKGEGEDGPLKAPSPEADAAGVSVSSDGEGVWDSFAGHSLPRRDRD